jgi:hypothetical protein
MTFRFYDFGLALRHRYKLLLAPQQVAEKPCLQAAQIDLRGETRLKDETTERVKDEITPDPEI